MARVTAGVNKHIQAKLTNEVSKKKKQISYLKKLKKIRGSKLCIQCSKLNEELKQNEPEKVPGIVQNLVIPAKLVGSQSLQSMARDLRNLRGSPH